MTYSRILAQLGATAAAVILAASPAWAHASLTGTDPVDGAVLDAAPSQVVLQFNEEPLDALVDVVITDAAGDVVAMDAAQAGGTEVRVPFPAGLAAGDYTVAYRVVSADGHPITGSITLTLTQGAPSASEAATAEPVVIDESAAAEVLADVQDNVEPADEGMSMATFIIVGAIAAAVLIGVVWVIRRRS